MKIACLSKSTLISQHIRGTCPLIPGSRSTNSPKSRKTLPKLTPRPSMTTLIPLPDAPPHPMPSLMTRSTRPVLHATTVSNTTTTTMRRNSAKRTPPSTMAWPSTDPASVR
uniref:Uncharacterized protein n=1 Tax=Panagrellus redivivus TaxID=6233 RepID=A0A7E4VCZ0_PANRE